MLKYNINDKVICHVKSRNKSNQAISLASSNDELYHFTIVGKQEKAPEDYDYFLTVNGYNNPSVGFLFDPYKDEQDHSIMVDWGIDPKNIGSPIIGCKEKDIVTPLKYQEDQLDIGNTISLYFDHTEYMVSKLALAKRIIPLKIVGINKKYLILLVNTLLFKKRKKFHNLEEALSGLSTNIDPNYLINNNYNFLFESIDYIKDNFIK